MKRIPLTNSEETAIVDDEKFDFISKFQWRLEDGYAVTNINGEVIEMGELVMFPWLAQDSVTN